MTLNARDIDILGELAAACRNHTEIGYMDGWARPLDCGAYNGSDHSYRLGKLVDAGMAESKQRSAWRGRRGSKVYRITDAGRAALPPRRVALPDED